MFQNKKKKRHITSIGFIFTLLGSCIGLGNIWRFPYLLSTQGGGAFLIVFLIAILLVGIPLFILETSLGTKFRTSTINIWKKLTNKSQYRLVGWITIVVLMIILIYYGVVFVWSLNSFFNAFNPHIWIKSFENMKNDSGNGSGGFAPIKNLMSFGQIGSFNYMWLILVIVVWLGCMFVVYRGITKSVEKVNKITIPIKLIIITILFIYCLTLPGAKNGINFLFHVDTKKLASISTWNAAFSQVFFSSSLAIGILFVFSRKVHKDQEIAISSTLILFLNGLVAIIIAIIVYSMLGWYAISLPLIDGHHYTINKLMSGSSDDPYIKYFSKNISGPGLLFNLIPIVLGELNKTHFFLGSAIGLAFFAATVLATFTCFIASITSISGNFITSFKNYPKWFSFFLTCIPTMLFSVFLCFKNSASVIGVIDHFNQVYFYMLGGLAEIFVFGWIVTRKSRYTVYDECNRVSGVQLNKKFFDILLRIFVCGIIFLIFIFGIISDFYPSNFFIWQWNNNRLSLIVGLIFGVILPIIQIVFYYFFAPKLDKHLGTKLDKHLGTKKAKIIGTQ